MDALVEGKAIRSRTYRRRLIVAGCDLPTLFERRSEADGLLAVLAGPGTAGAPENIRYQRQFGKTYTHLKFYCR